MLWDGLNRRRLWEKRGMARTHTMGRSRLCIQAYCPHSTELLEGTHPPRTIHSYTLPIPPPFLNTCAHTCAHHTHTTHIHIRPPPVLPLYLNRQLLCAVCSILQQLCCPGWWQHHAALNHPQQQPAQLLGFIVGWVRRTLSSQPLAEPATQRCTLWPQPQAAKAPHQQTQLLQRVMVVGDTGFIELGRGLVSVVNNTRRKGGSGSGRGAKR